MAEAELNQAFLTFAAYGTREVVADMDGKNFMKLCKDCKLVGKSVTPTDVDLIFAKVKAKTARRITFGQFVQALALISEKKGTSVEDVSATVIGAAGPVTNATQADYVKFHDDKSTYTGVYAKGGPTNVDTDKITNLGALLDRSPADIRGRKMSST